MGGVAGAHHARDTKLARHDGRVAQHATGVGDHALDLAEDDHPGRVGHLAYHDLPGPDLIELIRREHHPGCSLGDARRCRKALHLVSGQFLALLRSLEPFWPPPQGMVRLDVHRPVRRRANPVPRADLERFLELASPLLDQAETVVALGVGHVGSKLVVLQEHDVLGIPQQPNFDHPPADGHQHQAYPAKRALVNVEVVVWRQGHHLGGQRNRSLKLVPLLLRRVLGDQGQQLFDCRVMVIHRLLVLRGEVVVRGQVALDRLNGRADVLDPQLVDVLVGVHRRLDAELLHVRVNAREEPLALVALLQLRDDH